MGGYHCYPVSSKMDQQPHYTSRRNKRQCNELDGCGGGQEQMAEGVRETINKKKGISG